MKKRTFYIVNLDRNRILFLSVLFTGFILISFATGFRMGRNGTKNRPTALKNHSLTENQNRNPNTDSNTLNQNKFGKSIYALNQNQNRERDTRSNDIDSVVNNKYYNTQRKNNTIEKQNHTPQYNTRNPIQKRTPQRRTYVQRNYRPVYPARRHNIKNRRYRYTNLQRHKRVVVKPRRNTKRIAYKPKQHKSTFNNIPPAHNGANMRIKIPRKKKTVAITRKTKSTPKFFLQLGSFRNKKGADRMALRLKKQGFQPFIIRRKGIYRVSVGKAESRSRLNPLRKRLLKKKWSSIVKKL